MPRYRIRNRVTKAFQTVEAPDATEACSRCGWMLGDCHVEKLDRSPVSASGHRPVTYRQHPERLLLQEGAEAMQQAAERLDEATQLLRYIRKLTEVSPLDLTTAQRLLRRIHQLAGEDHEAR
jgi:hypothetical protein